MDFHPCQSRGHNRVQIQQRASAVGCRCEDPEETVGCWQQFRNGDQPGSAVVGFRQVAELPRFAMSCGSVVVDRRLVQLYARFK